MKRITHDNALVSKPSPSESGTAGYFTKAVPRAGVGATWMTTEWLNRVQDEVNSCADFHGLPVDTTENTILQAAMCNGAEDNAFINGDFDVWSFGPSIDIANPVGGAMLADGWWGAANDTETGTVTRQEFTPGQTDVPGSPRYFLRHDNTAGSGSTGWSGIYQRIRLKRGSGVANRFANGRKYCISFWARAQSPVTVAAFTRRKTSSALPVELEAIEYVNITTEWQQFVIRGEGNDSTAHSAWLGAGYFDFIFMVSCGPDTAVALTNQSLSVGRQSAVIDIAHVSCNAGHEPVFVKRRIADEHLLCASRMQTSFDYGTFPATAAGAKHGVQYVTATTATTNRLRAYVAHKAVMKGSPTSVRYNPVGSTGATRNITRGTDGSTSTTDALASGTWLNSTHPSGTQVGDVMCTAFINYYR